LYPGRASDLATFVKRGKEDEETFVEVDIVTDRYQVTTIRRTIFAKNNTSKWHMNHTTSTLRDVRALMDKLSIDVDNLCTFMPQDRVGHFTHYKPVDILQNTLKCIDLPFDHIGSAMAGSSSSSMTATAAISKKKTLYEEQVELSDIESVKEIKRHQRDTKQLEVTELTKEKDALTGGLNLLKRKENAKKHREYCEVKLLQVESTQLRIEAEKAQAEVVKLKEEVKQAEEKVTPLQQEVKELERQKKEHVKSEETVLKSTQKSLSAIKEGKERMLECDQVIDELSEEIEVMEGERLQKKRKLQKLIQDKEHVERQLENAKEKCEEIHEQLRIVNERIEEVNQLKEEIADKIGKLFYLVLIV
jgi:chromosome segregation ATPase